MELPLNTPKMPTAATTIVQSPNNKPALTTSNVSNTIFTKEEKNNAFGEKIFQRVSIINIFYFNTLCSRQLRRYWVH